MRGISSFENNASNPTAKGMVLIMMLNKIKSSITAKVAVNFTLLTLVLIIIMSVSSFVYSRMPIKQSFISMSGVVINNNADNLDNMFRRTTLIMDMLESGGLNFTSYLMEYDDNIISDFARYNNLEKELMKNFDISLSQTGIATFFVDRDIPMAKIFPNSYYGISSRVSIGAPRLLLSRSNTAEQEDWYWRTVESESVCVFKSPSNEDMIYIAKEIHAFYEQEYTRLGVFLMGIDVSWMARNFDMSKLTDGTVLLLADSSGEIIYSNVSGEEGKNIRDMIPNDQELTDGANELNIGQKRSLIYKNSLYEKLNLITIMPISEIDAFANSQVIAIIMLAALMLAAGVVLSIFLSRTVVRPIVDLSRHMEPSGELRTISTVGVGRDEIGVIYKNYNTLISNITLLIQQTIEAAELEKESRFKMLQAQINPHFIYNTLDTICCISLVRGQDDVAEIMSSLAGLIRYNVKDPDDMVSVEQELEQIYNYVKIRKYEDERKIELYTKLDAGIENLLIPKMIIQPLVENSFFYATDVEISFAVDGGSLIISVADNGQGDSAERINRHLTGEITLSRNNSGLGIRNVLERIQVKFGDEYGLRYERTSEGYTRAVITIPRLKK